MSNPELDVVEFLLTTAVYNGDRDLDEDDLPPAYRHVFWTDGRIERPLSATGQTAADATDVDRPVDAVGDLMFTQRDDFSGDIEFTDQELAEEWFLDRADEDRIQANPALAAAYGEEFDVSHETAR